MVDHNKYLYLSSILCIDAAEIAAGGYEAELAALSQDDVDAFALERDHKRILSNSDISTIRALEDIVEILRTKGYWNENELVPEARDKLSVRRGSRANIAQKKTIMSDGVVTEEERSTWQALKEWATTYKGLW